MKIERLPRRQNMKNLIIPLGKKIAQARKECGLSQGELAEYIGLTSPTAVSLYETDSRQVTVNTLFRIAMVCNVPAKYFFEESL